ncbi:MAG: serine O-acetyltransferase [Rubrivivax sp.]|nr:serine O-acetyltransferase [Rubrivivax sp.]
MFERLREDIACIRERDPAARSTFEVLTCYPGLHALVLHRWAHACWTSGLRWPGRFISNLGRWATGIEIHPGATIGRRVFIDHGMGVVIGETAEVGDECTIYQGVTLGGTSLTKGAKRHPTLGRGVIVSAGAKVLGGFTVGDGARVGSNAVLLQAVPPGATAVGIPARIVQKSADAQRGVQGPQAAAPPPEGEGSPGDAGPTLAAAKTGFSAYGVTQGDDPVALAMKGLIDNASSHEHQIALLWQAIEKLSARSRELPAGDCVPQDAATHESFDAEQLSRLVK